MLLQEGSTGQDVTDWQNFLNEQGYNVGAADGIFGANTKSGTMDFQKAQGLTADGIVGPDTLAAAEKLGYKSSEASSSATSSTESSSTTGFPPEGSINAVIDISHHNGSDLDFGQAAANGILGVIAKATQGSTYQDPMYQQNRSAATAAGLLYGAYHFATGQDVNQQLDNFFATADPDANTLLVLDLETNTTSGQDGSMSLEQAEQFVQGVHSKTGRWPGLYGGSYIKDLLNGQPNEVLSNCWLWLSAYNNNPTVPPGWETWTMWQYTDGKNGNEPHSVPGIGNCDREVYDGNGAKLRAFWKSGL